MSSPQTWASWFEWAAPEPAYFIDSRFELFPADVWDDYDAVARGGRARPASSTGGRWTRSWCPRAGASRRATGTFDYSDAGRDPSTSVGDDATRVVLVPSGTGCLGAPPLLSSLARGRCTHDDTGSRDRDRATTGRCSTSSCSAARVTWACRSASRSPTRACASASSTSTASALDRIAAGEMPFLEQRRRRAPGARPRDAAGSSSVHGRRDHRPRRRRAPRHRHARWTSSSARRCASSSGPSTRSRRTSATARSSSCAARSTRARPSTSPRPSRSRGLHVDVAFCPERIAEGHALEELRSLPQIIGADDAAAGDRAEALFGRLAAKTIRTTSREAELAKLFTNTWRYMKFAVANQFFAIADQAGVDYTNVLRAIREDYPRAADLPGPGFAAGPVPVQGHDAARGLHLGPLPAGPGGDADQRGHAGLHRRPRSSGATAACAADRRHPGHGLQGRVGRHPRARSASSCASSWSGPGATVLCADPYVTDAAPAPRSTRSSRRSEILVIGAPHRAYRALDLGGREVVDIWNATGEGIRL